MRTPGLGLRSERSTTGVLPTRSSTDRTTATEPSSAAGDGRQDRDDVVGADRRLQLVEIPHVVVVLVDVDELVDRPVVAEQLALEEGELTKEILEDRTDRLAVGHH